MSTTREGKKKKQGRQLHEQGRQLISQAINEVRIKLNKKKKISVYDHSKKEMLLILV